MSTVASMTSFENDSSCNDRGGGIFAARKGVNLSFSVRVM